ncbi:MAG: TRAP transporter large permease subunit [Candidatus Nezhaarchaeota archaeon]|nr:TRAP transporter large permease subunit [Candidatus Nezhaarchaeota archaeon]
MSPELVGIIGIITLLLLIFLGMPVAFAMALVGFVGFMCLTAPGPAFYVLVKDIFTQLSSYSLSAIPMFILMGCFAYAAGIGERLYEAAYAWIGYRRGGLAMATILACAGFAAVCGSTAATAAAMGRVALPAMKRYNYSDELSTGTVAAGGTLGILIPPSTVFIVYGYLVEESIGRLFAAGILPGLLLAALFVLTIALICRRDPSMAPPGSRCSWGERLRSLPKGLEALVLFFLVIGGLFLGWFSPTQAGAIGALGALAIGLARRSTTWRGFLEACRDALQTACMVLLVIAGAVVFSRFLAVSRLSDLLVSHIGALPLPSIAIVGLFVLLFFIGGFFIDAMALVMLLVPMIHPVLVKLNIDLIWFGVIVVLTAQMGVLTPPVAVNAYVVKAIAPDVPIETIFKGALKFLTPIIACTIIVMFFPPIATLLPSFIRY